MTTRNPILLLLAALLLSCDAAAAPSAAGPGAAAAPAAQTQPPEPAAANGPSAGGLDVENARVERTAVSGGLAPTLDRLAAGARQPLWIAYTVPIVEDQRFTCCWSGDWKHGNLRSGRCRLEGRNTGWGGTIAGDDREPGPLRVLVRAEGGRIGELRALSAGCALDAGGLRFVTLDGVDPDDSVAVLARLARAGGRGDSRKGGGVDEEAVMAVGLHAGGAADRALTEIAEERDEPEDIREAAIFWLGQARGRRGYEVLARLLRDDPSEDVREKAIFSLSQSEVPEAADAIVEASRSDESADVRGKALFWLAEMGDERAAPAILAAIENDPPVAEEAVFALTQLPDGGGIEHLERLAQKSPDPEVRGKALFWLSQEETERPETILRAVFDDPDPEVREQAVFALSQLEDGRSTELLLRVIRESRDPEVRKKALFWLGQSDDPEAMEALTKLLGE